MQNVIFRPTCLVCSTSMAAIEWQGMALEGGSIQCPSCGERYNYHITKEVGVELSLRRVSVPIGFRGPVEIHMQAAKPTGDKQGAPPAAPSVTPKATASGLPPSIDHLMSRWPESLWDGSIEKEFSCLGDNECADFAHLQAECKPIVGEASHLNPEVLRKFFILFVLATRDPLLRADIYLNITHAIEDQNSEHRYHEGPYYWDHLRVWNLARVPKARLLKFISTVEQQPKAPYYELKPGLFKKRQVFANEDIRRVLPKLKLIDTSRSLESLLSKARSG
jgi:hypothetical protein